MKFETRNRALAAHLRSAGFRLAGWDQTSAPEALYFDDSDALRTAVREFSARAERRMSGKRGGAVIGTTKELLAALMGSAQD